MTVLGEYLLKRDVRPPIRTAANQLVDHFGNHDCLSTPEHIYSFVLAQMEAGRGPATINRQLAIWSAAVSEYNTHHGTNMRNPTKGFKQKIPEGRVRWITHEEAQRLIDVAGSPRIRAAIELSLFTGMRKGELFTLEWQDVQAGSIRLQANNTKSKKSRTIPMDQTVKRNIQSLRNYIATNDINTKYVLCNERGGRFYDLRKSFNRALARAEITDFRWHDMRHTFASWLVMDGVPLYQVSKLLGHHSVTMTERYAHLSPDNLRDAVSRLPDLRHDFVTLASENG